MYVGRSLEQLQGVSLSDWAMEELAYFRSTFHSLDGYLSNAGTDKMHEIEHELTRRGGIPKYKGEYDLPSHIIFD